MGAGVRAGLTACLVALVLLLAGLAAVPAGATSQTLTGTIYGSDGRAVNALIGFDLKDELGRTLGATGCVQSAICRVDGYAITRRVNAQLPPAGSTETRRWATTWSVTVPSNTARVYVEVYPQGPGDAGVDQRRYGSSYRRNLPVPYGGRVNLRLPLGCGAGGDAGYVNGYSTVDGKRTELKRVTAFSMEEDNNGPSPVLGFQIGTTESNGYYTLPHLSAGAVGGAAGQRYQVIATAPDGRVKRFYGVRVVGCRGTPLNIVFD
ncbi:MAG: hypothetical protein JWM62_983 [Frankiales bacterium]|jgi:hypothetical protein|nr:hypothetical protein [Frankiales bacterium]